MNLPLNKEFFWKDKLYAHLKLARISNNPTVLTNVLAGAALSGVFSEALSNSVVILLVLLMGAMSLFYTAGMYLNDVFDYKIDLKERPERPLPSGQIGINTALTLVGVFFLSGLILLAFIGLESFASGLILVAIIIFYDYWHKTNPLSHYIMALTRVMVYVTAFFAFSMEPTNKLVIAGLLLFFYVASLTFIAKSETKPDFSKYWPVLFIFLPAFYFGYQMDIEFLPVVALFLAWCLYSLTFIYRKENKNIGGGIVHLIAGISLLDAMVLASFGAIWPIIIVFLLFGLTRFFQGYIKGS
ncbi:MAG: UbiA family prenyltransferase [Balneolales bacterium]